MASSQPVKPPLASQNSQARGAPPGLRYPSNGKTIYHRPLNRSRTQELSQASFAYLFGEMVSYAQKRVTGIQDLEKRLNVQGHPIGLKLSTCSSTANHHERKPALSILSPSSSSSLPSSGGTYSLGLQMRLRNLQTQKRRRNI